MTLFSQPPLLGRPFSREGNKAKSVNGRAKASENASIVIIGVQNSPCVDLISTDPTMGPVQEKETSTSVRARKNIPPSPPLSEFLSAELVHLEGRVISNAPRNDAAKTMNMTKNRRFGSQCVASQLKMSLVTVAPPRMRVRPMMMDIGTVYSKTMNSPYIAARKRPRDLFSDPLRKNDTVIGTMGNTHGVSSEASPQRMASMISAQSVPSVSAAAEPFPGGASVASVPAAVLDGFTSNSQSSGMPQRSPEQLCHVTVPLTAPSAERNFCFRTYVSLATVSPL